ncbi:hypothetical protein ROHU_021958 [Labeo rohita]|uniref:Uncharacterized protein n=1 Tax=Labeo rohita TaxID=84645 RepID=A0A498MT51_LABRO|nr:hypothetical protein ROHU_021958 [Labeo rohita]
MFAEQSKSPWVGAERQNSCRKPGSRSRPRKCPASPLPVAAARENEVRGGRIGLEAAGPSELLGLTTAGRPRS